MKPVEHPSNNTQTPTVLIVIDGWGENQDEFGNAIAQADTPTIDRLKSEWPNTVIAACGEAVGLPEGQLGGSEVGHLTIGAGRVIHQDLGLQQHAIKTGAFFKNEVLVGAIERSLSLGSRLHIMGLVSPGGVHSHQDSAIAVAQLAKQLGQDQVFVHAFTDGRDTPPKSAHKHLQKFESDLRDVGVGKVASISGRYYAMDRDTRWDRTELAYNMLTGDDHPVYSSAVDYINSRYEDSETDEFLLPMSIADSTDTRTRLEDNDVVIFFNFRPDRARQLSHALLDADFSDFERKRVIKNLHVVTFAEYDRLLDAPIAFPKTDVRNTLAEIIANAGLKQFHVAETEKYAHVTYFFNGGREQPFRGEERILVPSPKVATYDEDPQMSAQKITDCVLDRLKSDSNDALIVLNFANPDMVGHTGDFAATKQAVSVVDNCIGQIVDATLACGGKVLITADHGNAETEIDPTDNSPVTAHSTNPVPVIICGDRHDPLRIGGSLEDIAPTILDMMQLTAPPEMTGTSLFNPSST